MREESKSSLVLTGVGDGISGCPRRRSVLLRPTCLDGRQVSGALHHASVPSVAAPPHLGSPPTAAPPCLRVQTPFLVASQRPDLAARFASERSPQPDRPRRESEVTSYVVQRCLVRRRHKSPATEARGNCGSRFESRLRHACNSRVQGANEESCRVGN